MLTGAPRSAPRHTGDSRACCVLSLGDTGHLVLRRASFLAAMLVWLQVGVLALACWRERHEMSLVTGRRVVLTVKHVD